MALDLSEIRQQITQIDRSLLKLLSERHRLAYDVVRSKEITQKALRDVEREQQLLQELIQYSENENYQLDPQYITQIFQKIIEDSVLTQQAYLQKKLNEQREQNSHIAFLGKRGSYSHLAARSYATRYQKPFIELSCSSFEQVFEKVQNGEADYGILPSKIPLQAQLMKSMICCSIQIYRSLVSWHTRSNIVYSQRNTVN